MLQKIIQLLFKSNKKEEKKKIKKITNIYDSDNDDDPNERKIEIHELLAKEKISKGINIKKDTTSKKKINKNILIKKDQKPKNENIIDNKIDKKATNEKLHKIENTVENNEPDKKAKKQKIKNISKSKSNINDYKIKPDINKQAKDTDKNKENEQKKEPLEIEFKKYLLKLVKEDKNKLKDIKEKIKEIKLLEERILTEPEFERRNKLVNELLEKIKELKNKYYYLFLNSNQKRPSFEAIDINNFLNEKDNNLLKEKINKITNEIKKVDKELDKLKEEKFKEIKKVKTVTRKKTTVDLSKYYNTEKFVDSVLSYQKDIYCDMKKRLGKVETTKYTTLKRCIDYNKLLTSTIILSAMPNFLRKSGGFGIILGTILTTKSIKNLHNFIYYKEIEHQSAKMKNYENSINQGIYNLNSSMISISSALTDLNQIEKHINRYYSDSDGYTEICKKIAFIKKDLESKNIELKKYEEEYKKAKEINKEAITRVRKSRY